MAKTLVLTLLLSSSLFFLSAQVSKIKLPAGFKAEQLMKATREYGSFTCLAFDNKGYMYASDEKK